MNEPDESRGGASLFLFFFLLRPICKGRIKKSVGCNVAYPNALRKKERNRLLLLLLFRSFLSFPLHRRNKSDQKSESGLHMTMPTKVRFIYGLKHNTRMNKKTPFSLPKKLIQAERVSFSFSQERGPAFCPPRPS